MAHGVCPATIAGGKSGRGNSNAHGNAIAHSYTYALERIDAAPASAT
jgi:hypothetical protein